MLVEPNANLIIYVFPSSIFNEASGPNVSGPGNVFCGSKSTNHLMIYNFHFPDVYYLCN